jgi:hypothetical protein
MKFLCPNHCVNASHPIFAAALWCNREYLGGGGGSVRNQLSSTVYMPIYGRSGTKGSSAIGPTERYSRQAAEVRKAQFPLDFSALMPHGGHSINCRMEKG